jgi:hypothetical protein
MFAFLCAFRSLSTFFILSMLSLSGCAHSAHEVHAVGDPPPGKVDVTIDGAQDRDDDVQVVLTLEDLPPPWSRGERYGAYVVWLRPLGMHWLRAGELSYHEEIQLGVMRMVTPYESFEVLVTAERDAEATEPGPVVVDRRIVQRAR